VSLSPPQIEVDDKHLVREIVVHEALLARTEIKKQWLKWAHLVFFCCVRLAFGGFLLLTSVYCLLVWVPFTYVGFIHNPLLNWIPLFVGLHGLIFGILLGAVALTLSADLRRKETRTAALIFFGVNGCMFVYLCRGALARVQPNWESYLWSLLALFPLVWLAVLDLLVCEKPISEKTPGEKTIRENWAWRQKMQAPELVKTTLAAVVVSVAFAVASVPRLTMQATRLPASLVFGDRVLGELGASLCFHLVIFTIVGVILAWVRWMAAATSKPGMVQFVLTRILAWALFFLALRTIVLPAISFSGLRANIFAAVVAFAVVLFLTGSAARLRAVTERERLARSQQNMPAWLWLGAACALLAVAYGIPAGIGPTDWDFVVQKIAVLVVWIVVFQLAGWPSARIHGRAAGIAVFLVLTCATIGFVRYGSLALYNPEPSRTMRHALEEYSGADISLKTAYDILSHPFENKAYRQFYQFLRQHSSLGRDAVVAPVDIHLVSNLQPTPGIKPNIFFFVIDSLRRDYVSPYNPAVDYMPQTDRFARDSVVLKNAYTRYGGTALSEPAIWTGAMQLHKQYIEPFYPMNSLQKLLQADGYHSFITVDPILKIMLQPSSSITELDEGRFWENLDLTATLHELETKIDSRADRTRPIFAYTQPQNVHTLNLQRYRGDQKAAVIAELRRIDAAFGAFIEFLRQRGLYDNSIIILTADHGDSYGEFGRYGHSNFLFPEIIRIPLIIHLPPRMREQFVWDTSATAFTTDITPSLFYLLGHRPIVNDELFGRPLFTQTLQEQQAYMRPQYMIVSSYAPVYAILGGHGESLFIADAVNSRSYYYYLADDPLGSRNDVTIRLENENEPLIRNGVERIDHFYNWHPAQGGQ
jgi:hypothetical protein